MKNHSKLSNKILGIAITLLVLFFVFEVAIVSKAASNNNALAGQLENVVLKFNEGVKQDQYDKNSDLAKEIEKADTLARERSDSKTTTNMLLAFSFIIIGIFSFFLITMLKVKIFIPISRLIKSFELASKGDFTDKININGEGEIGVLIEGYNRTIQSMEHILKTIRVSSEQVLNTSQEVSSGNNQLSSSTQEMASSLEETAASVEEITSSIQEAASLSGDAAAKMRKTTVDAENGAKMLNQMGDAMKSVKESGDKIQEIVNVVNDIAFQTNLLALNAAVEAARAGEEGKGFAVVASEVRSLAARSADAATEIKELVENNEENIRNANELSIKTTNVLLKVVSRIQEASFSIQDVEKRAKEQASGIHQINSAIMQMDEVTQRNASLVEQLASSAEDMASISRELARELEKFKVSGFALKKKEDVTPERKNTVPEPIPLKQATPAAAQPDSSFFDDDKFEEF